MLERLATGAHALPERGPLFGDGPVGIIDVGSNSIRLVLYEQLSRAPTVLFNERVLAGLGRGLAGSGALQREAMNAALAAIRRFRAIATQLHARRLAVVATAAARDASNGPAFLAAIEEIVGVGVEVLTGQQEAELAAAGVLCGFWNPDGVVGDLGGGSLELIEVTGDATGAGESFPLGGLRLMEEARGSLKAAARIADDTLAASAALERLAGRSLYAVGGTWRSLARLHMAQSDYPVSIMHHYRIGGEEALEFCRLVTTAKLEAVDQIGVVSRQRRPLLPYGAAVLKAILERGRPSEVVLSALGVREGHLFRELDPERRAADPLLLACEELARLRARSPRHSAELIDWTGDVFAAFGIEESAAERRLRTAGCLLGDIGWRAHPDYRGDQAIALVANSAFIGIDHPARGYLALALYHRYAGLEDKADMPHIRELVPTRLKTQARLLGAALRVAYVIAPGTAGIIPRTPVTLEGERLVLTLPRELAAIDGERVRRRLDRLAELGGYASAVVVD